LKNSKHVLLRHKIIADILRYPVHLFFKVLLGYKISKYQLDNKGSYLILSNHIGAYDPILISLSFNRPIYYVASDHLFRINFISGLLKFCFAPIPISKTMIDIKSIKEIKKVASQNGCIGLFPSGNGSFNGEEAYISDSIGKLVKLLNIPVIIYNLKGLYFCTPRWAKQKRKGRCSGIIVKEIGTEEISKLTSEELSKIIITHLKTSAYKMQQTEPAAYKGTNLAMYLERVLYTCPKCMRRNFMKSENDIFYCTDCGNRVKYNTFGYFEKIDKDAKLFKTITEWDYWQKQYLKNQYNNNSLFDNSNPLYIDENIKLYSCLYSDKNNLLLIGSLKLFADRIEISSDKEKKIFNISDIVQIQAILGQILQFSTLSGNMYEIKSDHTYSALKYVHILNLIKNGEGANGLYSI